MIEKLILIIKNREYYITFFVYLLFFIADGILSREILPYLKFSGDKLAFIALILNMFLTRQFIMNNDKDKLVKKIVYYCFSNIALTLTWIIICCFMTVIVYFVLAMLNCPFIFVG